jgi:predicted enzyme related to lactoylglutathione lyase
MANIDGVGAIMIYAAKPQELADWYSEKLGITTHSNEDGTYTGVIPNTKIFFGIFPEEQNRPSTGRNTMVNYHVTNFLDFCQHLKKAGVAMEKTMAEKEGLFAYIRDGEGNPIEIWSEQ